jgi:FkbM family methyltransferase
MRKLKSIRTNFVNGQEFAISNPDDTIQQKFVKGTQWNKVGVRHIINLQKEYNLKHLLNIGAHMGSISIPLSKVFNKVTSVEPYPPNWQWLQYNIGLNNITNIESHHYALGNSNETIYFSNITRPLRNNSGGVHSLTQSDIDNKRKYGQQHSTSYSNQMHKLDEVNIDNFDIIVMDVEGTEWEVIDGALQKIKSNKPFIITEIWSNNKRKSEKLGSTREQMIEKIESIGYQLYHSKKDDFYFKPCFVA